jgi:hypothetical protein
MSYRVTEEDVMEIIEVDSAISLLPFIALADLIITEDFEDAPLSVARLKEVERWLSAHFYAIRDPRVSSEGAGGVSNSYVVSSGTGFNSTPYGQQAVRLDTTGTLAAMDSVKGSRRVLVEAIEVTLL